MKQFVDSAEADVLWRLARATCDKAKSTADKAARKELMYDAFRAAELALKIGDTNFACHKVFISLSKIITFHIRHSQAKCILVSPICLCVCLVVYSYTTAPTQM